MHEDIFAQRKKATLGFFILLAILTLGSIILTKFDVVKGFTSFGDAFIWGVSNFYPDAKSMTKLSNILIKLKETVLTAIAATTGASIFALMLGITGSRTTRINNLFSIVSRGIASFFRNIPLVAWAMVLMLAFGQSALTGYIALFLGSIGFLTRSFMETIDEVSLNAVEALKATGASPSHIIVQAVLPSSLPQMLSWLLYMMETNIRDATLVGILTGTGIGFSFDMYYKRLDYHTASLTVILIVITVILIEILSNKIRRVIL